MDQGSYEKISTDSEDYQKERETAKSVSELFGTDSILFGEDDLQHVNTLRERVLPTEQTLSAAELKEKIENILLKSQDKLKLSLSRTDDLMGEEYEVARERVYDSLVVLYEEAMQDDEFNKAMNLYLDNFDLSAEDKEHNDVLVSLYEGNQNLPMELYEQMLKIHVNNYKKQRNNFEKMLPSLSQRFKERVLSLSQRGELPISEEILNSRIKETTFLLVDPVVNHLEEEWEGIAGSYDVERGTVYICSGTSRWRKFTEKEIEHVLFHEMLHSLSGRTIIRRKIEDFISVVTHQRVGLGFGYGFNASQELKMKKRFFWLNEAITEKIAMDFAETKSGSYSTEREIYEYLLEKGSKKLDEKLFFNAYFENHDASRAGAIPAWKTLQKALDESFGPGFLLRLDKRIKEDGAEYALGLLKLLESNKL